MSPTLKSTGGWVTLGQNLWVFPLEQTRHVRVAKSEHPRLTNDEIIFEKLQPVWSQFTNVTDRQTDRQTTCDRNTALCTKVHRAVKTVPLTAAACSESDGQRDWFPTAAVHNVVWHNWAGDRDKLFCVQSVSECQFHMRSHDSVDAFLDCLPDWAQGLRHCQFLVDTHRTRSATARLPINRTGSLDFL